MTPFNPLVTMKGHQVLPLSKIMWPYVDALLNIINNYEFLKKLASEGLADERSD